MRKFVSVLVAVGFVAAGLTTMAALSAAPAFGGGSNGLVIEKVVVGDPPAGYFLLEVDCDGTVTSFMINSAATPKTESLSTPSGTTCAITEVDDLGADDVTITCTVDIDPNSQAFCDNNTTARFGNTTSSSITLTVTNTFVEDIEDEAAEPAADVVEAAPAFTG